MVKWLDERNANCLANFKANHQIFTKFASAVFDVSLQFIALHFSELTLKTFSRKNLPFKKSTKKFWKMCIIWWCRIKSPREVMFSFKKNDEGTRTHKLNIFSQAYLYNSLTQFETHGVHSEKENFFSLSASFFKSPRKWAKSENKPLDELGFASSNCQVVFGK